MATASNLRRTKTAQNTMLEITLGE